MDALLLGLTLLVVALQMVAGWRVLYRSDCSDGQKALQLALILFLPVLGAVLCLLIQASDDAPDEPPRRGSFVETGGAAPDD